MDSNSDGLVSMSQLPNKSPLIKAFGVDYDTDKVDRVWTAHETEVRDNSWLYYNTVIGYNLESKKFKFYEVHYADVHKLPEFCAMYLGIAINEHDTWFDEHDELLFLLEWADTQ